MGLETLKSAERAAGFAMAAADDPTENLCEPTPEATPWQPAEPLNAPYAPLADGKTREPSVGEWVKGLFGFSSGRRAPA